MTGSENTENWTVLFPRRWAYITRARCISMSDSPDLLEQPWLLFRFAPHLLATVAIVVFAVAPYTVLTRQAEWWLEYPLALAGLGSWVVLSVAVAWAVV